jgi:hypothetical protein
MTYMQVYEKVYGEYAIACQMYREIERRISQAGSFGNVADMDEYLYVKKKWLAANNNYWSLLACLRGREFDPDEEACLN